MATTLTTLRQLLDIRLGQQYNNSVNGAALLNLWINMAGRYCWEWKPLGFNETSTSTIPTITNDEFTLPTTALSLLKLKYGTGSGSANFEEDVAYTQHGRTIRILEANLTPTRLETHDFWTDLTADDDEMSTYIPDYLILELAAYFATGETRNQGDQNPVQINKAMMMFKDWVRKFNIKREKTNQPMTPDGRILMRHGGTYSPGLTNRGNDYPNEPFTVGS